MKKRLWGRNETVPFRPLYWLWVRSPVGARIYFLRFDKTKGWLRVSPFKHAMSRIRIIESREQNVLAFSSLCLTDRPA